MLAVDGGPRQAVWNATPNWTVKGGLSKGYKTPRVEQLSPGINGFGGQGTIALAGSPGLKPETSTTTELGAYSDNLAGWTASFSVFNNEFKDSFLICQPCRVGKLRPFNGFYLPAVPPSCATRGRRTVNTVPDSRVDSASIVPQCAVAISRAINSPRPMLVAFGDF